MQSTTTIEASRRELAGTGASRRMRRNQDCIPAVVYGGSAEPCKISLLHKDIYHALQQESFYTQPFTLSIDGKGEQVILKALQRHPARDAIVHADFLRVTDATILKVQIPIHLINEDSCVGVRRDGGNLVFETTLVEVSSRASNIPEYIEVDVAELGMNESIMLSGLKLPDGVSIPSLQLGEDHDQLVVQVIKQRVVEEIPTTPAEAVDEDAETETDAEESTDTEDAPEQD